MIFLTNSAPDSALVARGGRWSVWENIRHIEAKKRRRRMRERCMGRAWMIRTWLATAGESAMLAHPMKPSYTTAAGLLAIWTATSLNANDWPQWRGPQRNGISQETGLLKEWPKEGPKLLWNVTDVGSGYAAPSVIGDRIFILGNEGLENENLQALAVADGKRIWSARLG